MKREHEPDHHLYNEGLKSVRIGTYDYRVDMYFRGTFIASALVKGCHGYRAARMGALRGIETSVYPMTDRDQIVWTREQHKSRKT